MIPSAETVPVPATVVWDPSMMAYDFGEHHPMAPARLELTARLCTDLGLFDRPGLSVVPPFVASDAQLETVHSPGFVAAVRRVSAHPGMTDPARGLGTEDDPVFAGMHDAAARLAGGSWLAAERILDGSAVHAVNFGGGMHHASREAASGFCIYNDAAVAVQRLLDGGARRIAYVDVDAHHGDGTESIFYNEPRVLTISLHESGLTLFPGTGFAHETGGPNAPGTAANIALPAATGDAGWLRAFHAVVPQLVEAFAPEVIVSQHGCDSHRSDPLTHLNTSVDAQREAVLAVSRLARRCCGGRWLATGGGGYNVSSVVPRAWSHLVAIASGSPLSLRTPTPQPWRDYVRDRFGRSAPEFMGEDADTWWRSWEVGYDPADAVDRAVMATRRAIFPLYGLDPYFD
ncbi:MAG: acetoin utilization protein AcuC [Actinomycetales bacterium]